MEILKYVNSIKLYKIEDIFNKEVYIKICSLNDMLKLNKLLRKYNELFYIYNNNTILGVLKEYGEMYIQLNHDEEEYDEKFKYGMTWYKEDDFEYFDNYIIIEVGDIEHGTIKVY